MPPKGRVRSPPTAKSGSSLKTLSSSTLPSPKTNRSSTKRPVAAKNQNSSKDNTVESENKNATAPSGIVSEVPSSGSVQEKLLIIEEERDFYQNKLRDLELLVDEACRSSGGGDHTAIAAHQIRSILYASNELFKVTND